MCHNSLVLYIDDGTYKGFFQSSRGLCQGDSLSPYLFIMMEKVLSHLSSKRM